jgi:hypothetical protein
MHSFLPACSLSEIKKNIVKQLIRERVEARSLRESIVLAEITVKPRCGMH